MSYTTQTSSPTGFQMSESPIRPLTGGGTNLTGLFESILYESDTDSEGPDDSGAEDYGPGYESPVIGEGPDNDTPAAMAERGDIEAAETAANALKAHRRPY